MLKTSHAAGMAAAVFVVIAGWILGPWQAPSATVVDSLFIGLTLIAVGSALVAAKSAGGKQRAAWILVAAGRMGWMLGAVLFSRYDLTHFPSWADVGYLLWPVCGCVALLLYQTGKSGQPWIGLVLDGVIVATSLFLVAWFAYLDVLFEQTNENAAGFIVSLAYPVTDTVLLTATAVVLVRAGAMLRLPLVLLTIGVAAVTVSDSGFAYLRARSEYHFAGPSDIGWVAGLLLISVAAFASRRVPPDGPRESAVPGWPSILLPYAPVLLAGVAAAAAPGEVIHSPPVQIAGTVLFIAVLTRQFLVVNQSRQLLRVVAKQALVDPLTGVGNRAVFNERLAHAMHSRQSTGNTVAVIEIDVDHFKPLNDTHGHLAGDAVLVEIANRLAVCADHRDTVARLGGDEFAIVVQGPRDHAHLLAEAVVDAFDKPFAIAGDKQLVSASIGVAVATDDLDMSPEELLRRADIAMYAAKRSRIGGVHVYSAASEPGEADRQVGNGATALQELRQAIDRGDLTLEYQPLYNLSSLKIVGAEALLRWPHPARGVLIPDDFLRLIRRHGLIRPITEYVAVTAAREASRWRSEWADVPVAINVFVPSLSDPNLPEMIIGALTAHGLDGSALTLEITEDLFATSVATAQGTLNKLRDYGIRIAIDDFGSGYAPLFHLLDLPVDEIKIGRKYVSKILVDPKAAAIVRCVIELAHAHQLTTVAKGIESAEIAVRLKEYGCDVGQGYFFSKPVTADELFRLPACRLSVV